MSKKKGKKIMIGKTQKLKKKKTSGEFDKICEKIYLSYFNLLNSEVERLKDDANKNRGLNGMEYLTRLHAFMNILDFMSKNKYFNKSL